MYIRTASERDLPAVSRLIAESLHASHDAHYGAETVARIAAMVFSVGSLREAMHRPRSEFLVADDGEAIAGAAFAAASDEEGRVVDLVGLFVVPALAGRGIGGMLLQEIEESFFESERIRLELDARNARALGFFSAEGYETVSDRRDETLAATLVTLGKSLV